MMAELKDLIQGLIEGTEKRDLPWEPVKYGRGWTTTIHHCRYSVQEDTLSGKKERC